MRMNAYGATATVAAVIITKVMVTPITAAIAAIIIVQSSLIIPGSNADDDEPTTILAFHDKGHCHQYIQDHPGLAADKKNVLERY